MSGAVTIQRGDKTIAARQGTRLRQGNEIVTPAGAEALMPFDDTALIGFTHRQ